MSIPINSTEDVTVQTTQQVQLTAATPHLFMFDGTDKHFPTGSVTIKANLFDADGVVYAERTYMFSGAFYESKVDELSNPMLTHRQNMGSKVQQAIAEVENDAVLKQQLIDSGELIIDPLVRMRIDADFKE